MKWERSIARSIQIFSPVVVPTSKSFLIALSLSAGFAMFTAWDQSYWWAHKSDYGFGWLVPALVAYVVYLRWGKMTAPLPRQSRGGQKKVLPFARYLAGIGLVVGVVVFLIGALYRAAAGPSYSGTLAITLGTIGCASAAIYFTAPTFADSAVDRELERQARASFFFFPLLIWLVSAPMITAVESNLNLFFMKQVTSTVFIIFDFLGIPLEQHGNILVLPNGNVGVAEACSGIRSLTGCLFAGSFLAAVYLESGALKMVLVLFSLVLAVLMNLLRSLFLTAWAYTHGAAAIEGTIHDVSGYSVLGLTTVALFCLVPLLERLGPGRPPVQPSA